jgi:isopentenyl-diphosphate delta-isomerase
MESDQLIVVHPLNDTILDACSKRQGHSFSITQPHGICHRAFSLLIFDQDLNMMLTQRAATKITFPNVWTNACCSHPLWNMPQPYDEVDVHVPPPGTPYDTSHHQQQQSLVQGIKYAAMRKVQHELGYTIASSNDIIFLTRFYYWAADCITHGQKNTPWGEHEVDYVLLYQLPATTITTDPTALFSPHPDEVSDYQFVSRETLHAMMFHHQDDHHRHGRLLWSPWFRGIMSHPGWDTWWNNKEHWVSDTMAGAFSNWDIYRLEPHPDHVAVYDENDTTTNDISTTTDAATAAPTIKKSPVRSE